MKKSRRYFVRLFSSIIAIALAIVLLEVAVVSLSAYKATREWPAFVAGEYVKNVDNSIISSGQISPDTMITTILSASTDSISGVIIRDENGNPNIFYGDLFQGSGKQTLIYNNDGELDYTDEISSTTAEKDDRIEVKVNTYAFNLDEGEDGVYSFSVDDTGVQKISLSLPPNIRKTDVAASVSVNSNGVLKGYFDIIVFGVSSYPPTSFIIKAFTLVFILIIPISLIIAVIASWIVSRRSSRSIEEIKRALESLAKSNFDIEIKAKGTSEYDDISASIMHLSMELKRNQQARKEWIRSISHDLNTPITALQLLVDGASDGVFPLDKSLLENMNAELGELSSRIASVSYYSKLISPEARIERSSFSTSSLVSDVVSGMKEYDRFIVEDKGGAISADRSLAERALYELCENALKYSKDKVRIIADGTSVKVISNSHLPTSHPDFFEPWARGDVSRHAGGSGMGLPIAGAIMALHGGNISLEERKDGVVAELDFREK